MFFGLIIHGILLVFFFLIIVEKCDKENPISSKRFEGHQVSCSVTVSDRPTLKQLLILNGHNGQRVRVIDSVAAEWEELAIVLGFEPAEINYVKRDYNQNARGACREILTKWLNGECNHDSPITWGTLIQCLIDAGHVGVAEDLQETLK